MPRGKGRGRRGVGNKGRSQRDKRSRGIATTHDNPVPGMYHGRMPVAPVEYRTLTYFKESNLNNAGSAFANFRLQPTNTYDVGITGGASSIPFYTAWSGMYRFSRLISAKLRVEFSTKEAIPLTAYVTVANSDPGLNNATTNFLAQKWSKHVPLGPITGEGTGRINYFADTAQFAGAAWNGQVDFYTCSTSSASATNNWYFMVGVQQAGSAAMVSGVDVILWCDMNLAFFEIGSPATFYPREIPKSIVLPVEVDSVSLEEKIQVEETSVVKCSDVDIDPLISLMRQLKELEKQIALLALVPNRCLDE